MIFPMQGIVRNSEATLGEPGCDGAEICNRQSGYSSSKRVMTRNNVSSKKSNLPEGIISTVSIWNI